MQADDHHGVLVGIPARRELHITFTLPSKSGGMRNAFLHVEKRLPIIIIIIVKNMFQMKLEWSRGERILVMLFFFLDRGAKRY